jgi:hypothetical protein
MAALPYFILGGLVTFCGDGTFEIFTDEDGLFILLFFFSDSVGLFLLAEVYFLTTFSGYFSKNPVDSASLTYTSISLGAANLKPERLRSLFS